MRFWNCSNSSSDSNPPTPESTLPSYPPAADALSTHTRTTQLSNQAVAKWRTYAAQEREKQPLQPKAVMIAMDALLGRTGGVKVETEEEKKAEEENSQLDAKSVAKMRTLSMM